MRLYRFLFILPVLCLLFFTRLSGQSAYPEVVNNYILQYKTIAVKEMLVYRVPASITLAQGILESNAGRSRLAVEANNHFGIKCHKGWTGDTFYQDDDEANECFRKYNNANESFRDHSYFLTQRERYKGLFELEVTDYVGWALGLKAAGYATNPTYAQQLIGLIEKYALMQYDLANLSDLFGDSLQRFGTDQERESWLSGFIVVGDGPAGRKLLENNRLSMTLARAGDNLGKIARDFGISVRHLADWNDMGASSPVRPGAPIYLESKRRKAAVYTHIVKEGDNLHGISQRYGIKLKMLYKRNNIPVGMEPPKGMLLELR